MNCKFWILFKKVMTDILDKIWQEIEPVIDNTNVIKQITICTNCDSSNLIDDNDSIICKDCGLTLSDQVCLSDYTFTEMTESVTTHSSNTFSKISVKILFDSSHFELVNDM